LALQIGVPSLALRVGVVATLAVAVAIAGSLTGCHSSSSADPQQAASLPDAAAAAVRVTAARPVRKTLRLESVQPGQIEAFEQTPLFAKLPAYVEKLYVDIGDRVEGNQLLVDLFLPELKDEVRQKEAALVQAQAEIELATAAIRAAEAAVATARANISAAEAGNIRADADYTRWQSQFARISQLVTGGSLDRKLEDETRDSLKAAEAARGEAHAKVQSAKATLVQSQADVAKAKANEAVARARQGNAQADLSRVKALLQYTQIRAPYAGVVTERNVVRGDFVQPASTIAAKPLLAVARTDIVRIFVDVPEMESPSVEAGRGGYVNVQALPDRIVEGKVARTSWVLGPNRTLRTELDLPNPNGLLRPGMYATAHILLQERPDVYVLPLSAIVREGKQAFCWIVKEAHAVRIPLTLGLQVGNDVEVVSGLKADELVVQSPAALLQEGRPVQVAQPEGR
jgi:RND family efflux transporter MFP subunit